MEYINVLLAAVIMWFTVVQPVFCVYCPGYLKCCRTFDSLADCLRPACVLHPGCEDFPVCAGCLKEDQQTKNLKGGVF